jgi:hypothetical protein
MKLFVRLAVEEGTPAGAAVAYGPKGEDGLPVSLVFGPLRPDGHPMVEGYLTMTPEEARKIGASLFRQASNAEAGHVVNIVEDLRREMDAAEDASALHSVCEKAIATIGQWTGRVTAMIAPEGKCGTCGGIGSLCPTHGYSPVVACGCAHVVCTQCSGKTG